MAGLMALLSILAAAPGRLEGRALQVPGMLARLLLGRAACTPRKHGRPHSAALPHPADLAPAPPPPVQLELPATAAAVERLAADRKLWVPRAEELRPLLDLVKRGGGWWYCMVLQHGMARHCH